MSLVFRVPPPLGALNEEGIMPIDWSQISVLDPILRTTPDDVVISGHGSYEFDGETAVPAGFELWVPGPPGSTLTDALGGALEHCDPITKLAIRSRTTDSLSPVQPTIYRARANAPDYRLHSPRGITIRPGGPHIIGVEGDDTLSALWARVQPFAKAGRTIRVFWAACTAITGARNQTVLHQ
ncbi:MAG: hypothetical protein M0006_10500 [Magnetospirillum sp.]|nr:hypothetical protein [Magnetospirillum sp.]